MSSRSSSRRRATFALAAIAAAALLSAGVAFAHVAGFVDQTATAGFSGISNEEHGSLEDGTWTFEVVDIVGKIRNLTLVIKWPCVNGDIYYYNQITKPAVGMRVTTPVIDADAAPIIDAAEAPNTDANYCSQISFPGGRGSITVRVLHPPLEG